MYNRWMANKVATECYPRSCEEGEGEIGYITIITFCNDYLFIITITLLLYCNKDNTLRFDVI